jgi:zinc protease
VKKLSAVALCLLAVGTISAQEKEFPPEGSAPKEFRVPRTQNFTLPNGLQVTLAPYGLIPKTTIVLGFRGGAVSEPKGKDGVGTLLASLMKEGTATRTSEQFARDLGRIGGALYVISTADDISIQADSLSDFGQDLVGLVAEVAMHAKLPESELDRLRKDQLRNISLSRANAQTQASEEFHEVIFGDNGYGRILPSEDSVKALQIADVRAYYSALFLPNNAHLYVSGVIPAGLRAAIEKNFSAWEKGAKPEIPAIQAKAEPTLKLIDRPNAPQSTIFLGLPVPDPTHKDAIPLQVTDSILGGSFMSRITSNIREQKGYSYSPRSQYEFRGKNGVWIERADVTTAVTGASLKEIFGEIDKMRKEAPPAKELTGIQNGMAGTFILQNSTPFGIINQLRFVNRYELPADYLDTYVGKVMAVKPPDVQAMTEKYLHPDKMTIVVVGDKSKISDQVAPYKPNSGGQ